MPEPVIIVPYDPAWASNFESIRSGLEEALGDVALDILHVGSTSVVGLAAKPIIDIDVVIDSEDALRSVIERLATIDYVFEGDRGVPRRYAFTTPGDLPRHHLYVCAKDNLELKRQVAFRDFLRENPKEAAAYGTLKCELASHFGLDRDGYSRAKTEFVEQALAKAAACKAHYT
jgi:GrpB-like predicted nucleotidyltransferase (UPF0157 family)